MSIDRVTRKDPNVYLDAMAMAEALFDDHMATNPILIGAAYQAGALPITSASIERAIRLNGVSVEMNLLAFRWGRMAVVDAKYVEAPRSGRRGQVTEAPVLSAEARARGLGRRHRRAAAAARGPRARSHRVPERDYARRYVEFVDARAAGGAAEHSGPAAA